MQFSSKFVSATTADNYETYAKIVPAPYLRKSLTLDRLPDKAEITVCGLGFYKLYVNGREITKGLLAPYISNSDNTVFFDNYTVTEYLRTGKNAFAFVLGNGFQNCIGGHPWRLDEGAQRSAPKLAFAIELFDGDRKTVIEADESVKTHDAPILFNDIRCGVHYDATLEIDGWNEPDFDDAAWQPAVPVETPRGEFLLCGADPIVVKKELAPKRITPHSRLMPYFPRGGTNTVHDDETFYHSAEDNAKEGYLYDFGENNAGILRLKIKNTTKGQRILLQPSERVDPKTGFADYMPIHFYPEGFVQRDIYICRGGDEEIFVPDFCYHGFRYCWVSGITDAQAVPELLTYLVASSDLDERCGFRCSDEMSNKLWDAGLRSDLSNFYYFPTDCPHREKNGWTGDAAVSAEHMVMKLTVDNSYHAWLRLIRNTQRIDGAIPGYVPTVHSGFAWGNGPIWDSVIFALPYYLYLYRGDTDVIRENASMMMRYLDYISKQRDAKGLIHIGLGDWCPIPVETPDRHPSDYDAPLELTDSIATMDNARKAAILFRAVGYENQAAFADRLFEEMRCAIRKHLINFNTMLAAGSCESSQALTIALGVFEPAELSEAYTRLLELIESRDEHLDTGFYGARYIFHVLTDFGDAELAFRMITRPDYPSYGNWIVQGATTLWESFYKEDSTNMVSQNHHFWGDISSWYMKTVLGLTVNPDIDDPDHIDLSPNFLEALDHAEGYYVTLGGTKLEIGWKRSDTGAVVLHVVCPPEIHGTIRAPYGWYTAHTKATCTLKTGDFTFEKRGDV